jgi:hypothetical protein
MAAFTCPRFGRGLLLRQLLLVHNNNLLSTTLQLLCVYSQVVLAISADIGISGSLISMLSIPQTRAADQMFSPMLFPMGSRIYVYIYNNKFEYMHPTRLKHKPEMHKFLRQTAL